VTRNKNTQNDETEAKQQNFRKLIPLLYKINACKLVVSTIVAACKISI